ncbi:MAG: RsmB/NOP family class I SAM-dependent RNA methyltransferase [Lachnospiraceae bacterium]|nr:RsmB/NOP family class I SAM-dependent RNA methyltransferase [Lachnospiraceae bacterium]
MTPNLPEDFISRMKEDLKERADLFLRSYSDAPKKGLRINKLKTDDKLEEAIAKGLEHIPWEEHGYYYNISTDTDADTYDGPAFGRSPLHAAGAYYIQEPSAMAPVRYLDIKPGMAVLDLCASPGGKSTQAASYLAGSGLIVCNEIVPQRASVLSSNIERMGIRNAVVTCHSPQELKDRFPAAFDRILVDAPCSGEGMFRKEPASTEEWSKDIVDMCAARQKDILDATSVMLKPGGRLVYSTCTFSEKEDEEQAEAFLSDHVDYTGVRIEILKGMRYGRSQDNKTCDMEYCFRIWPEDGYGEGHFAAVFQRDGEESGFGYRGASERPLSSKEAQKLAPYRDFIDSTFVPGDWKESLLDKSRLFMFGQRLCLMPEDSMIPLLSGLRTLRAGLELGEFRKDRFIPSHALALAVRAEDMMRTAELMTDDAGAVVSLTDGSDHAGKYLNGQTLDAGIIKGPGLATPGWTLVTVSGISLGWARSSGGILKNHYPKGLRIP